ncbi:major facilitator superfamily domain-containing protein [Aspergillus arachidicola]|uniref:Major facilitator superfamily domain-containing protein n=1 Tax=Aspergillus arachidicola TaxID=656916 RepID=A0A5N6YHJ0_9EURO|nr:major facilitator superfamily domain-containing protein [Aspergillus arachidicola]
MAPASSPPTQPTSNIDQSLEGTPSFDGVEETEVSVPMTQTVTIITSITFIAADLHIPPVLQLWPTAAFALACGCVLLPSRAAADHPGRWRTQLIALRVIAGVAASFCLPSAVGVTAHVFPANSIPRRRSIAFAAMGGGQAVGFGLGLALGGVFSDKIGWRWGFYVTTTLSSAVLALALWAIPKSADGGPLEKASLSRLRRDNWIGALLISACLALLSYELAVTTDQMQIGRQVRLNRPALISNSLWTNVPFTAVCITVFLVWGSLNASEQLTALYLQDVRGTSTLTASLNAAIGISLPYLKPSIAVPARCLVSGIAPLLLATLCGVDGPGVFQAMALNPLGVDLIYTIANLVMTESFPARTQALAGGVFNILAQVGKSVGIATSALIARQITSQVDYVESATALLKRYKAGWWYNCGLGFVSVAVSFWGLRSVKRLEIKRD